MLYTSILQLNFFHNLVPTFPLKNLLLKVGLLSVIRRVSSKVCSRARIKINRTAKI